MNLAPQERAEIVRLHLAGMSSKTIAKTVNVLLSTVYRHLHKANIHLNKFRRKVMVDCARITDYQREDSAYWSGFFLADGYISKEGQISLKLAARDKGHLEKFAQFVGIQREIPVEMNRRKGKLHSSVRIFFSSKQLVEAFYYSGIYRKNEPRIVPDILRFNRHFWRGVVDGDGHLGLLRVPRLVLVGERAILQAFHDFAEAQFGNLKSIRFKNFRGSRVTKQSYEKIYRVQFYLQKAVCLAEVLYKDTAIALDRKSVIAKQMYKKSQH